MYFLLIKQIKKQYFTINHYKYKKKIMMRLFSRNMPQVIHSFCFFTYTAYTKHLSCWYSDKWVSVYSYINSVCKGVIPSFSPDTVCCCRLFVATVLAYSRGNDQRQKHHLPSVQNLQSCEVDRKWLLVKAICRLSHPQQADSTHWNTAWLAAWVDNGNYDTWFP